MKYAKKLNNLDNVIVRDSLKNFYVNGKKYGYQFELKLDYYRGHFLSVIDEFEVHVDGERVPDEHIKFCINGKAFSPIEFDKCYSEFWPVTEAAVIKVIAPGGLAEGEHQVDVIMYYRSPYMPIGDNHEYMANDNCGSRKMVITDQEGK